MIKPSLSIIVPTLNEERNIVPLVKRIDKAMSDALLTYEVIFVDDRSSDRTAEVIKNLQQTYPITFYTKKGNTGKAYSLLEGFSYAQSDLVAMIDADLQYPPEALPTMANQLRAGVADVIVADRDKTNYDTIRRFASWGFSVVFGQYLHGLNVDVQSGLKAFRREIVERVKIVPSPWTFDLDFLIGARNAGYSISSIKIAFHKRYAGKSKIGLVHQILEIGIAAVKSKLAPPQAALFHSPMIHRDGLGFHYRGKKFVTHTTLLPQETALTRTTTPQKLVILFVLAVLTAAFLYNGMVTATVLLGLLTAFYIIDFMLALFVITKVFLQSEEQSEMYVPSTDSRDWPTYTIFCPLYKEAQIIPQFTKAMMNLDYPKDKLEVLLLLEDDDVETINAANAMNLPSFFHVLVVPDSLPKTKPKACNFGLARATGEFAVIYDAEDIPERSQLKKAILTFEQSASDVVCVQAKLNYYNANQNLLTRFFTMEYSLWFDLMLPALQMINAPIPLGGTSNHFRTQKLQELGGWDPFNVTEDADLGMRIMHNGYKTAIVDSVTMEEANSQVKNWIKQRSRWLKGYMQTYLVHMRHLRFSNTRSVINFLGLQIIIGGAIISMLVNPFMWLMTISYFAFTPIVGDFIEALYMPVVFYPAVITMVFGNFFYAYLFMMGSAKRGLWELVIFALLSPLYWVMMSVAAVYAFWELLTRPHHWNKTVHGLHLNQSNMLKNVEYLLAETPAKP